MKRAEIVAKARQFVLQKTRWHKMGRSPQASDCYGLIVQVCESFGIKCEDYQRYTNYPSAELFIEPAKRMGFTFTHTLQDGQVWLFQNGDRPRHMGISATDSYGRSSIIHIAANRRFALEEAFEPVLKKHFRAAFDFPGIED